MNKNKSSLPKIKSCLESGLRLDGRSLTERRNFLLQESERLQTNSLYGCRIQNPETGNWIYFSLTGRIEREEPEIKLQIEYPESVDGQKSKKRVNRRDTQIAKIFNFSMNPQAKRFFDISGDQIESSAQDAQSSELKSLIEALLLSKLDLSSLKLDSYSCSWHLTLNIFSLSPLALHDLDYLLFGLSHLLISVKMPLLSVSFNALSKQFTFEVLSDTFSLFEKKDLPTIFLIGEVQGNLLVDLTSEELQVVDSLYVASFRKNGVLREIQKVDGKPVQMGIVNRVLLMTRKLILDESLSS